MNSFDHIHLFKTNIRTEKDKRRVQFIFNKRAEVQDWNIDQEDEDCVLRVISYTLERSAIIKLITRKGYFCAELL